MEYMESMMQNRLEASMSEYEQMTDRIKELESQLAEAKKGTARYEFIRKLHPHEFACLWRKNINGEGLFDDLIDAAMQEGK